MYLRETKTSISALHTHTTEKNETQRKEKRDGVMRKEERF